MPIEFEGELTDQLKREIDCLVDGGFDPERELEQNKRQLWEEEKKQSLLLPTSCIPTLGEVIQSDPDKTMDELVQEYERIILSTPPSHNITFDLVDFKSIRACEIACSKYAMWMKSNYIRLITTERMRKALLDGIASSQKASARGSN